MAWRIKFSDSSIKSLKSLKIKEQEKIRKVLKTFISSLEQGKIPFREIDIKKLKGKWEGFLRIKIGKKLRIILRFDESAKEVYVYEIGYRGRIYK